MADSKEVGVSLPVRSRKQCSRPDFPVEDDAKDESAYKPPSISKRWSSKAYRALAANYQSDLVFDRHLQFQEARFVYDCIV